MAHHAKVLQGSCLEQGGYLYPRLAGPDRCLNGFYTGRVYPLIARLIRQLLVCEEVNQPRFFSSVIRTEDTEPSHWPENGGSLRRDIHSSAAAPTDGESSKSEEFASAYEHALYLHDR